MGGNACETAIPDVPHHQLEPGEFQTNREMRSQKIVVFMVNCFKIIAKAATSIFL
jgi:hypothetical protein